MPAYDPDPGILEERAYGEALAMVYTDGGYEAWDELEPSDLTQLRESIRDRLLYEYDALDGRTIAEAMDDALADTGFPFDRLPA